MADLIEHKRGLLVAHAEITAQIRAVSARARQVGCEPHELMTTDGGFVLAPLLAAIAHVEVALLQIELAT